MEKRLLKIVLKTVVFEFVKSVNLIESFEDSTSTVNASFSTGIGSSASCELHFSSFHHQVKRILQERTLGLGAWLDAMLFSSTSQWEFTQLMPSIARLERAWRRCTTV